MRLISVRKSMSLAAIAMSVTLFAVQPAMAAQNGRDAQKSVEKSEPKKRASQPGQRANKRLEYAVEPLPEKKPSMATQRGLHAGKNSGFWVKTDKQNPGKSKQHPQIKFVQKKPEPKPRFKLAQAGESRPANEIKPARQGQPEATDPNAPMSDEEKRVREYLDEQENAKRPAQRNQHGSGYDQNVDEMRKSQDRLSPTQPGRNRLHR